MYVVSSPMVTAHKPLKSSCCVSSHAAPINRKVCAEIAPSKAQIHIAGIQPVPPAIPEDSVRIPAPATLLIKLKMDAGIVALPPSSSLAAACLFFFFGIDFGLYDTVFGIDSLLDVAEVKDRARNTRRYAKNRNLRVMAEIKMKSDADADFLERSIFESFD